MGAQENKKMVQDTYAAFGRGDIAAVLASLSDDVDWQAIAGAGPHVPTSGPRRGRAQVQTFFAQLGDSVDFKKFEPREFVAEGDKVVTLGYYEAVAKKTGRSFKSEWVMVFTFANGKVVKFREYADSAGVNAAF
jgi:ketosteroid isomerase-like protein